MVHVPLTRAEASAGEASNAPRWWLHCECCDSGAIPPSGVATEDDATEDLDVGDPMWSEEDEARCPDCGCMTYARFNGEFMEGRTPCVDADEDAMRACPCKTCKAAVSELREGGQG
jgi:hypothetical protein